MARLGLQTLRSSTDDNVYQLNAMQTWCVHPPPLLMSTMRAWLVALVGGTRCG